MASALWIDKDERLWLAAIVPDDRWADASREVTTFEGSATEVLDYRTYFDSIIAVIDPGSGRVIAWQRFDQAIGHILNDGRLVGIHIDEDGFGFGDVMRLRWVR